MITFKEVDKSFLELYDKVSMSVRLSMKVHLILLIGDFLWHLMAISPSEQ